MRSYLNQIEGKSITILIYKKRIRTEKAKNTCQERRLVELYSLYLTHYKQA